ncbi:MAG: segregation/condensation protein A [Bacteroidota bacterium]
MNYEIKLPLFQGPFDLLLFFIERDELDIHDIPISKITEDFLAYIREMEQLNIELASEFILVAATLMRIKSKMLLPRPELDKEGNEIDPREELVRHLLEYKKYKSVLGELGKLEISRLAKERRGNVIQEIRKLSETTNVEAELQDVDLYKLLKVYGKVLKQFEEEQNKPVHEVVQYPFTISGQKEFILNRFKLNPRVAFTDIVSEAKEKIEIIYNFLAILELLQARLITMTIGEGFNNFWIEEKSPED